MVAFVRSKVTGSLHCRDSLPGITHHPAGWFWGFVHGRWFFHWNKLSGTVS
jgi:hypothetical protein